MSDIFSYNDSKRQEYQDHTVFNLIKIYVEFYYDLSNSIMSWSSIGTRAILNLDSYVYSSMCGTIESIHDVVKNGRINDGYSLLRKFHDSVIINIYSNLYLNDNFSIEQSIVEQIDHWITGKDKLPAYRIMSTYVKSSGRLTKINKLLDQDDRYKKIRKRCNDHTHYNYYHLLSLNDNKIDNPERLLALNQLGDDLENLIILHLSSIFTILDHYMMSSDYIDCLEVGVTPEEDSQYFVAPFIQDIFEKLIKSKRPDIAAEIKSNTQMQLK